MKFKVNKKTLVAGAIAAGVIASAGVGYAVWNSPAGSGNGNATGYTAVAGNVTSATSNSNSSDATDLYPGSSVTNTVTITNNNPYPVNVISIADASGGSDAAGACAAGTVTSTAQNNAAGIPQTNTTVAIPAHGTGVYSVTYTMASTATDDCQTASFVVPLTIGSQSSAF